jgi:hypothetical protein
MTDEERNMAEIRAVKDTEKAHSVATAWRPVLQAIVRALANGDFALLSPIPRVAPVDPATAKQIEGYLAEYAQSLRELADETWNTSVAQWMGSYWDVLVDLWTVEGVRSDLVLSVRVFEDGEAFRIRVEGVYVP